MKKFLLFLLKGSFSNQTLLDESDNHSYISSTIILILSLILAVVPMFVSIANTDSGALFTTSPNASLDLGINMFSEHLNSDSSYVLELKNGQFDVENAKISSDNSQVYFVEINKDKEETTEKKTILAVAIAKTEDDATNYSLQFASGMKTATSQVSATPYSHVIFTPDHLYIKTYLSTATNTLNDDGSIKTYASLNASYVGDAKGIADTNLKDFYIKNYDQTVSNWKSFSVKLANGRKTSYLWSYTGILFAINTGVVALVSLLLFFISRMKSSQRRFNYFEALKVISFSSLLPAIIGLALGFMISAIAQIGFVLCIGLRTTFLTMKSSNPTVNG